MTHMLLNMPEDIAWILSILTDPLNVSARASSAEFIGVNEDSPQSVRFFDDIDPMMDDSPIAEWDSETGWH